MTFNKPKVDFLSIKQQECLTHLSFYSDLIQIPAPFFFDTKKISEIKKKEVKVEKKELPHLFAMPEFTNHLKFNEINQESIFDVLSNLKNQFEVNLKETQKDNNVFTSMRGLVEFVSEFVPNSNMSLNFPRGYAPRKLRRAHQKIIQRFEENSH